MATLKHLAAACFLLLLASPLLVSASYDFFYLSLMWPGAYCVQTKAGCCRQTTGTPVSDFLVTGFTAANSSTGKTVSKCGSTSFYKDQIANLTDDLNQYWSSIKCPSNDGMSLWKSAWKTYGVCTSFTENEYFKLALEVRKKINILSALNSNGILASKLVTNGKSPIVIVYSIDYIQNAITNALGVRPVIQCSMTPEEIFQVYQVYVCVDKDGQTLIDCPSTAPKYTCSPYVMFYPFQASNLKTSAASMLKMPVDA